MAATLSAPNLSPAETTVAKEQGLVAIEPAHREDINISFSPAKKGEEVEKRLAWLEMRCYL